jgi:prolyl-tRNA synthetase
VSKHSTFTASALHTALPVLDLPPSIAPYDVRVVLTEPEKRNAQQLLAELEATLDRCGKTLLVDDRRTRPGEKFADADLIGCPTRITIGRGADAGLIEIRRRASGSVVELPTSQAHNELAA